MTSGGMSVKVGSRKSELALIQTRYVIQLLKNLYPENDFEIVTMTTLGDRVLNISLPKIGEKSLFTKDLEEALENGSVDLVVHSLKDLPTSLPKGMAIGAVLEREDPRDALVLREDFKGHTLATLPLGSIIGTSSLRRTAQLSRCYPHLKVVDIRGNLNTRLKKLDQHCKINNVNTDGESQEDHKYPEYAALILANAGLVRMGWQHRISQVLPSEEVLYAVGQGALAIECRANNDRVLKMLAPLNHQDTYCRILSERSFLKTLGGGCSAPVAISTSFDNIDSIKNKKEATLQITGAVWSLDGKIKIENSLTHIFNSNIVNKPTCPYKHNSEAKEKPIKHKLSTNGNHVSNNDSLTVPPKKQCTGIEIIEKNEKVNASCCKQIAMNKALGSADTNEIENLISVHGKLYSSCPYYNSEGGCPVRFPVGGEFMGKCPVLSEDSELIGNGKDLSEQLVMLHPKKLTYDIKKCPFMSNQIIAINTKSDSVIYNVDNESKDVKCPFLKENEKIEANGNSVISNVSNEDTSCDAINLYCGLTKHFDISEDIITKCEDIGRDLAQSLIDRGALDVMKCAQDCIRSSIPTVVVATAS